MYNKIVFKNVPEDELGQAFHCLRKNIFNYKTFPPKPGIDCSYVVENDDGGIEYIFCGRIYKTKTQLVFEWIK